MHSVVGSMQPRFILINQNIFNSHLYLDCTDSQKRPMGMYNVQVYMKLCNRFLLGIISYWDLIFLFILLKLNIYSYDAKYFVIS